MAAGLLDVAEAGVEHGHVEGGEDDGKPGHGMLAMGVVAVEGAAAAAEEEEEEQRNEIGVDPLQGASVGRRSVDGIEMMTVAPMEVDS